MNAVFVVCVALYGALVLIEAVKLGVELVGYFEDEPKAESALALTVAATVLGCVVFFYGGALWEVALDVMAQDTLALKYWFALVCAGVVFAAYWFEEYSDHQQNRISGGQPGYHLR